MMTTWAARGRKLLEAIETLSTQRALCLHRQALSGRDRTRMIQHYEEEIAYAENALQQIAQADVETEIAWARFGKEVRWEAITAAA